MVYGPSRHPINQLVFTVESRTLWRISSINISILLDCMQRINIPEILEDEWFTIDYKPPVFDEIEDANLDDVEAVFKDSEVRELFFFEQILKNTI